MLLAKELLNENEVHLWVQSKSRKQKLWSYIYPLLPPPTKIYNFLAKQDNYTMNIINILNLSLKLLARSGKINLLKIKILTMKQSMYEGN